MRGSRLSALAYVDGRSVGLRGRAAFEDAVLAQETQRMAPVRQDFIFRRRMRVWAMALDPVDSRFLLVGTATSKLLLFDLQELERHEGDSGEAVAVYDTSHSLPPVALARARHSSPKATVQFGLSSVDWYPVDGGIVISSALDGHVSVWDSETMEMVSDFALQTRVYCAKFSRIASSHALIAAATAKAQVRLCDMRIDSSIHSLLGHQDEIWTLAWSLENEHQLATGSRNGELRLWDIRRSGSTACLLCLNHEGRASAPGRSTLHTNIKAPLSTSLASASRPPSRKRSRTSSSDSTATTSSTSSRSRNSTVRRNDPHAAASASSVIAHHGGINSLAFTPDGRFLLSSGNDQKLRLWNSKTGEHLFMNYIGTENTLASRSLEMAVVQEGDAWDSTTVFHPNGPHGELAAFRVFGDHGEPLGRTTAHYNQITSCVYRPTKRELYTGGEDGLIMRWKPTPVELSPEPAAGDEGAERNADAASASDVDNWSSDDEDAAQPFVPPILRQEE